MEYKFENINCNVCGADNTVQISKNAQFGLPFNLMLCKDCGLGYLNPRWDSDSYLHYYQYEYDKYYRAKLTIDSKVNVEQADEIVVRLQDYKLMPEKVEHILEIGSGEGANLRAVSNSFPSAQKYSIEPSVQCQVQLKKMNINMIAGTVEEPWENEHEGKFDIIIVRHVLEHLLDPADVLRKVRLALSDSGIAYIAVPDNLYPRRTLEGDWFRVVHSYYFNKYSMYNLLSMANLEAIIMKEGHENLKEEIFVIAQKTDSNPQVAISVDHYNEQWKVLDDKMKSDKRIPHRLLMFSQKVRRKLKKLAQ